eukprot:TRINITY_DN282_c0_g1_i4.p1 TRINITY_DN282_c0_g1~~TRINITY_DN282_c0_g1_i4.p1  ORF type:complete len:297 (+),score=69.32 TRINITY_DN282_c0_g1_i4:250-1140(+)
MHMASQMAASSLPVPGTRVHPDYELGHQITSTKTSVIHAAVHLQSGQRVAVKLQKIVKENQVLMQRLGSELGIQAAMSKHPNVLPVLAVSEHDGWLCSFMLLARCDLYELLVESRDFSEDEIRSYALQLVSAIEHCHANGVFHRDLKPENVMVDDMGNLRVADFGFACRANKDEILCDRIGTASYAAPEVLDKDSPGYRGESADVWSLGVIFFVLAAKCFPFKCAATKCKFYSAHVAGMFSFPDTFSLELQDLLSRMWTVDPAERIGLDEIRQHEWFQPEILVEEIHHAEREEEYD